MVIAVFSMRAQSYKKIIIYANFFAKMCKICADLLPLARLWPCIDGKNQAFFPDVSLLSRVWRDDVLCGVVVSEVNNEHPFCIEKEPWWLFFYWQGIMI